MESLGEWRSAGLVVESKAGPCPSRLSIKGRREKRRVHFQIDFFINCSYCLISGDGGEKMEADVRGPDPKCMLRVINALNPKPPPFKLWTNLYRSIIQPNSKYKAETGTVYRNCTTCQNIICCAIWKGQHFPRLSMTHLHSNDPSPFHDPTALCWWWEASAFSILKPLEAQINFQN